MRLTLDQTTQNNEHEDTAKEISQTETKRLRKWNKSITLVQIWWKLKTYKLIQ